MTPCLTCAACAATARRIWLLFANSITLDPTHVVRVLPSKKDMLAHQATRKLVLNHPDLVDDWGREEEEEDDGGEFMCSITGMRGGMRQGMRQGMGGGAGLGAGVRTHLPVGGGA